MDLRIRTARVMVAQLVADIIRDPHPLTRRQILERLQELDDWLARGETPARNDGEPSSPINPVDSGTPEK